MKIIAQKIRYCVYFTIYVPNACTFHYDIYGHNDYFGKVSAGFQDSIHPSSQAFLPLKK